MNDFLTIAEQKGLRTGWDDAERYAKGSKSDRREIRRRLAKSEVSYAPFWRSYSEMLCDRAEAFGKAIAEGRIARTIRPTKLFALKNREYAALIVTV